MAEPVATRVDNETKQWLENRAEQEDITVSKLVAGILETNTGQSTNAEPDSTEARLNKIETETKRRIAELEQDIAVLVNHAENMENKQNRHVEICNDIELENGTMKYPILPGNEDGNVYGNEKIPVRVGSFRNSP
mgnify:CR=1 FL=1